MKKEAAQGLPSGLLFLLSDFPYALMLSVERNVLCFADGRCAAPRPAPPLPRPFPPWPWPHAPLLPLRPSMLVLAL